MHKNRPQVEVKAEVMKPDIDQQMTNFLISLMFLSALSVGMIAMFVLPRM